ncbi:MAG: ABC transporter permease [Rhodobacterales bacterium]|nr:MAG: ABC transporter permease [Rhodobacterales bacterium]
MIRLWPLLTVLLLVGPVAAGLWGALLPAFGHLPAAGLHGPSLEPFHALLAWPGLAEAVGLSVRVGLVSTVVSLVIVTLFVAGWSGTRAFARLVGALSPLLSVPHAAAAFGIAAMLAPSGWLARAMSPWATGWQRPADLLFPQDPWGVAMSVGLIAKEVPFLLLMTLAALQQVPEARLRSVAATLGQPRITGWFKAVFPLIYRQLRLPIFAVLAYAMSVVDLAIILGPSTPPPLAVQIVRWTSDPDIARRSVAAAAALLQLGLVLAAIGLWLAAEKGSGWLGQRWIQTGRRGGRMIGLRPLSMLITTGLAALLLTGLAVLGLWSVAGPWRFPDILPSAVDTATWSRVTRTAPRILGDTALIAGLSTVAALTLTLGTLETLFRRGRSSPALGMIYIPLIVPQIAFLPGLQVFFLHLGADRGLAPVVLAHLVFVLPYMFLSLSGPFHAWDARLAAQARSLGASQARVFWHVRLPMMLRPILTALALGIAVSVAQYLPTLLMGGGRIATLTTEALALASGGDRRMIGAYGILQTLAAIAPFGVAIALPAYLFRNRRAMRHD